MLRVLIQVLCRDPVAAGRCLACESNIAFENLVGVAAYLYVRTIAIEGLDPVRHSWTVVVRVVSIAAARALVWSWSHDTCLIAVDIIGPLSGRSSPLAPSRAVSLGCRPYRSRRPAPSEVSLVGTGALSNLFLFSPAIVRTAYDETPRDAG